MSLPLLLILGGRAGDLWHLFGSTNQLLAGLSLTVAMVWLFVAPPWQDEARGPETPSVGEVGKVDAHAKETGPAPRGVGEERESIAGASSGIQWPRSCTHSMTG